MGRFKGGWQDTRYVLSMFGGTVSRARRQYKQFVAEGIPQGRRPELIGGGLVRSVGGWGAVKKLRKMGAYQKGDVRPLNF